MDREMVQRAGLRYPAGDPDDFTTAAHRLARVSAELQPVPGRIQQLARLGEAWTGAAAEWFRAGAARSISAVSDVSGALRLAALGAQGAGEALRYQQQTARRLAEQVIEATQEAERAEHAAVRAEEQAEQARARAAAAAIGSVGAFSLAEQARLSREAQVATQQAAQARERATRAREHHADLTHWAERTLRELEADTERADTRARSLLDEVSRTLAAVTGDDSGDGPCPLDTPLFTTGAGLLPMLTHGRQLARQALSNPLGPLADSAKGNAYRSLADGLREIFPGTCIGPQPPTPPSDPPSPRPEPVQPAPTDEPGWLKRRVEDAKDLAGDARDAVQSVPGAVKDGYDAYDSWTDQALDDAGSWLDDHSPAAPGNPSPGPVPPPPIRLPPIPLPGPG